MRVARLGAEAAAWWAVAFSVWMVSLSAAPLQEYLLATACSFLCGVAAVGARLAARGVWRVRAGWFRPVLLLPITLASDTVQVLLSPLHQGRARRPGGVGRFDKMPTGAIDDVPVARSARAVATILVSVTPGSFVVDADPSDGSLLVHRLGGWGPQMTRVVSGAARVDGSR